MKRRTAEVGAARVAATDREKRAKVRAPAGGGGGGKERGRKAKELMRRKREGGREREEG